MTTTTTATGWTTCAGKANQLPGRECAICGHRTHERMAPIVNVALNYRRDDGTQGSVITPAGEPVRDSIAYYLGMGYSIASVDAMAFCGRCQGTGSVRKSLRHKLRTCPSCQGKPEWPVALTETYDIA